MPDSFTYLAYGGGVNSLAIVVGLIATQERPPDLILFADTGGEKPETYLSFDIIDKYLIAHLFPSITRVKRAGKDASLEAEMNRLGTLPALAFGFHTCSAKWKVEVQMKWLKNNIRVERIWTAGNKITRMIGFDMGEERRTFRMIDDERFITRYPLMEWKWDRSRCIAEIEKAGLPIPMKSACFFCPASKPYEVLWLQENHPDLLDRALAMEDRALGPAPSTHPTRPPITSVKGLGRSWNWRALIETQNTNVPEAPDTPCICFDGEDE